MKKMISIIGPMYNEEALVSRFCKEVLQALQPITEFYDFELVLVDDGSIDGTLEQMYQVQNSFSDIVSVVQLSRNFGLEGAVYAGLQMARGDAVVVMDADLQDPPSIILEMVKEWENGADIVVGSRAGRSHDGLFKRLSAKFFYKTLTVLSGKLRLEKDAANFRLMNRKAVSALLALPEVNRVFRVAVPFLGMKTSVVAYHRDKRFAGKTKYSLRSMIRYAMDSLTGISVEPLHKIFYTVFAAFFLTLFSLVGVFFVRTEWKPFFLISAVVSLLFTLLFFIISVIAEYLSQIYIEVKKRPSFLIYDFRPSESARKRERNNDAV